MLSVPEEGATDLIDVRWHPRSDFMLTLFGIPRIIVEVKSTSNEDDRSRMLAQGVTLVRLANALLAKNNAQRDFVLMAIYFDVDTTIDRYLLYQQDESSEVDSAKVCDEVVSKTFPLT